MNKKERQGIANAFRACLPYLWDGVGKRPYDKSTFICTALQFSGHEHYCAARTIAADRLCGFATLNQWLHNQIGEKRYYAELTWERMQAHRRAWVLKMIKEFES